MTFFQKPRNVGRKWRTAERKKLKPTTDGGNTMS